MNPELSSLIVAARSIAVDAKAFFGQLNAEQLNWKPDARSWSVGQCLEHLILTNDELLKAVEKHVDGTHQKTIFERFAIGSKFLGKQILKAAQPENRSKIKAPKVFRPTQSAVEANVVSKFVEKQAEVARLMERSAELDLEKTILTSPVARFLTYSLFDVYKIVVYHERRHFRQAQNVMKLNGFPE